MPKYLLFLLLALALLWKPGKSQTLIWQKSEAQMEVLFLENYGNGYFISAGSWPGTGEAGFQVRNPNGDVIREWKATTSVYFPLVTAMRVDPYGKILLCVIGSLSGVQHNEFFAVDTAGNVLKTYQIPATGKGIHFLSNGRAQIINTGNNTTSNGFFIVHTLDAAYNINTTTPMFTVPDFTMFDFVGSDTGYFVGGSGYDTTNNPTGMMLLTNASGYQRKYYADDRIWDLEPAPNGHRCGLTMETLPNTSNRFFTRYNRQGNQVVHRLLINPNNNPYSQAKGLIATGYGEYFCVAGTGALGPAGLDTIDVLKLDANGNILWRFNYGMAPRTIDADIAITGPNDIVVTFEIAGDQFLLMKLAVPTVSVEDPVEQPALSLFPNPSAGILNVEVPENGGELEMYDISGRQVFCQTVRKTNISMDLSTLKTGMYFVSWCGKEGRVTKKWLKE